MSTDATAAPERAMLRAVAAWALAHGRSVRRDALAVVVGAAAARPDGLGEAWSADGVARFLWHDAFLWCRDADVAPTPRAAEALWVVFDFLHQAHTFPAGSDPLPVLRGALRANGGLRHDGRLLAS